MLHDKLAGVIGALLVCLSPTVVQSQVLNVTLLGTGGPEPAIDRFGPSVLVEAGPEKLLVDAGRGTTQRLWQLGVRLGDVNALFLTHLHSDHTVGIPDLWLTGWLRTRFGRRNSPLSVWGPKGSEAMMAALKKAYEEDIRQRTEGSALPAEGIALDVHDVGEGVVYQRNGVKVTAFNVDHGAVPMLALGYRIDYAGRSVIISGDTRPSENLIRFATGADVVVHEVMAADSALSQPAEAVRRVMASHTSPEEAGRVFDRVKPKLAVYTHIGLVTDPSRSGVLLAALIPRTRTSYSGPLEIGEDLMTIGIGDTVAVHRVGAAAR